MKVSYLNLSGLSVAALALTACGGGGSSTPPAQAPVPVPLVSVQPGPAPAPAAFSYAPGSQEKSVLDLVNQSRTGCGFSSLAPNSQLSSAAAAHAAYNFTTGTPAHNETPGNPYYSGVDPAARALAAGYQFGAGEVVYTYLGQGSQNDPVNGARQLLAAPYHSLTLLFPASEIGIGYKNRSDKSSLVINIGLGAVPPKHTQLLTYPCSGSTNVAPAMLGEFPNPIPGRDLAVQPTGPAIVLRSPDSATPILTEYSLTSQDGAAVPLRTPVTSTTDSNLSPGEVFILPNTPLTQNTTYKVTLVGTLNGVAFSKVFSFKTGNAT